jgi:hypothetical protein
MRSLRGSGNLGVVAHLGQVARAASTFSGWSRHSLKVARLMPVDLLISRRL